MHSYNYYTPVCTLAKQGDNALGTVRPSVFLSALSHHYQSKVFVYLSNNHADAVDRLLIMHV